MIKKTILISILLTLILQSYSYDCNNFTIGEARKLNYEINNVVFLGIPIKIEKNIGEFIVIDKYKGSINKKIIVNYYKPFKDEDVYSLWLIYGNKYESDDSVYVDVCSMSRSINNPFSLSSKMPPPIMEDDNKSDDYYEIFEYLIQIYENQWRQELYDEIKILKSISDFEQGQINNDVKIIENEFKIENYIIIALLILILFFNVLIFYKRK